MRHKILEIGKTDCEAVALNIIRNDAGDDVVEISAWHQKPDDGEMYFQSKEVALPSFEMCENFIDDFSYKSAESFAELFEF